MSLFLITMLWGLPGVTRALTTSADGIAADIRTEIESYMEQWFNKKKIEEIYNTQTYTTLTGREILKEIKKNVTIQFLNSEKALSNIREGALDSFYNYKGDTNDFDFLERFKNRTYKNRTINYHKTANFKREISVTNSSLVLPLDVYYNWTEVRETILWTAAMDPTFKANWSPNLTGSATLLQYIGTPHGVMRVYPSYYTPRVGKWVTYDHRFRIWYAVGAMESNKVVFLMDKSGTLVGEPVKLMREMAINFIKTMISDEDYISVLTFNDRVEPLGCGRTMVRARSRIKTILNEQIRKIEPEGAGNLTEAIRVGFEILNKSRNQETCHSTLVLFTDYTQNDVELILKRFNTDRTVKIVILQVGKDIMFATNLNKTARAVGGKYAKIEDLSDISPTILRLTSAYTSLVDDDDLQVKTTPMYMDASTEEYITTLVLPVVTDQKANWTKKSSLHTGRGSFLGVAAVDIEAKSLGQYPLSNARGCYSITVDLKGSVLYHPVLYKTKESVEIDQKLHLYSFLNEASTMKEVEQGMVFQNLTDQAEMLYVEVSDSSMSKKIRTFANKHFFNVLVAVKDKASMLHICNRQTLSFPKYTNVKDKRVADLITSEIGKQKDDTRDTAYCSYSNLSEQDFKDAKEDETVEMFIKRKLQFPECHSTAYEIFDDIFMVSNYLSAYLMKDPMLSVTTAAGNRFEINKANRKLRRTNNPYTRERYTRLISLVTNSGDNNKMITITNVTNSKSRKEMFEMSEIIYHMSSNSFPLMLSLEIPSYNFSKIIEEPFRYRRTEMGGSKYLVDENGFIISTDAMDGAKGAHLAKLFPRLMQHLIDLKIYSSYNHTECYFSCEDYYPKDSRQISSSASIMKTHLQSPTIKMFYQLGTSAVSFIFHLLNRIIFLICNPLIIVSSMPDSSTKYNQDWKSIKINLTCCHIHPFMSRNFSVPVSHESFLKSDETCAKSYKFSSVPNTNLLFVWSFCNGEHCSCDGEPSFNLQTVTDHILNPCQENDDNYNPAAHCTKITLPDRNVTNPGLAAGPTLTLVLATVSLLCVI